MNKKKSSSSSSKSLLIFAGVFMLLVIGGTLFVVLKFVVFAEKDNESSEDDQASDDNRTIYRHSQTNLNKSKTGTGAGTTDAETGEDAKCRKQQEKVFAFWEKMEENDKGDKNKVLELRKLVNTMGKACDEFPALLENKKVKEIGAFLEEQTAKEELEKGGGFVNIKFPDAEWNIFAEPETPLGKICSVNIDEIKKSSLLTVEKAQKAKAVTPPEPVDYWLEDSFTFKPDGFETQLEIENEKMISNIKAFAAYPPESFPKPKLDAWVKGGFAVGADAQAIFKGLQEKPKGNKDFAALLSARVEYLNFFVKYAWFFTPREEYYSQLDNLFAAQFFLFLCNQRSLIPKATKLLAQLSDENITDFLNSAYLGNDAQNLTASSSIFSANIILIPKSILSSKKFVRFYYSERVFKAKLALQEAFKQLKAEKIESFQQTIMDAADPAKLLAEYEKIQKEKPEFDFLPILMASRNYFELDPEREKQLKNVIDPVALKLIYKKNIDTYTAECTKNDLELDKFEAVKEALEQNPASFSPDFADCFQFYQTFHTLGKKIDNLGDLVSKLNSGREFYLQEKSFFTFFTLLSHLIKDEITFDYATKKITQGTGEGAKVLVALKHDNIARKQLDSLTKQMKNVEGVKLIQETLEKKMKKNLPIYNILVYKKNYS